MLGQKRNASLFAAPEAPLDTVVSVPVPSESIGGTLQRDAGSSA